ncbi:MAG: hypothetical protein LBJ61_00130 [Deltaproteobacteria bacterium]|nr:hypothetical protein [Deltaproteobacteria bacterium]
MSGVTSCDFLFISEWFNHVVGGEDVVLRQTSALECHQLFLGWLYETTIEVYAMKAIEIQGVDYRLVDTFDHLEIDTKFNLRCTSINQTVNDMLDDYDNIDPQPLVESLSSYYYSHGRSFDSLKILPRNMEKFEEMKDWALDYYNYKS